MRTYSPAAPAYFCSHLPVKSSVLQPESAVPIFNQPPYGIFDIYYNQRTLEILILYFIRCLTVFWYKTTNPRCILKSCGGE